MTMLFSHDEQLLQTPSPNKKNYVLMAHRANKYLNFQIKLKREHLSHKNNNK